MIKAKITGAKQLQNFHNRTKDYYREVASLDGTCIDENDMGLVSGSILHQSSENMTEQESAQFELNNPELVVFLESLKRKLEKILAGQ